MSVDDLSRKHTGSLHHVKSQLLQRRLELNFYLAKASNIVHGLQTDILRTACLEATNHVNKLLMHQNEDLKNDENAKRVSELKEINDSLVADISQLKTRISSLESDISQNIEDMTILRKQHTEHFNQEAFPEKEAHFEHTEGKASNLSPDKTSLSSSNTDQITRLHRTITDLKKTVKDKDSDLNKLHSAVSAKESELDRWKIKLETEESNWKVRLQVLESKVATQGKKLRKNEGKGRKSTVSTLGLTSPVESPLSPASKNLPKKSPLRVTPYLQRTSAIIGISSSSSHASPTARSGTTTQTPAKELSLTESAKKVTEHDNMDSGNAIEHPASPQRLSSLTPSKIPLPVRKKRKFETDTAKFEEPEESDTSMTMEVPLQTKVTLPRTISPPKARSETLVALKDKFKIKKGV
ncbi:microtubule-site clamp monopolin complex subunit Mde4 [Schizosaccharomyces osmophilus]|uniref:Microtubule-site clamp monopolin complex subunit Mde4 n=1 Tax=Schizosaccharomyces osmophilus TaxID=2545709 RepID=A0AAE9WBW0_9SCHI|nr:microtubule-site clamp monopolin complex subunit Mde4 [Schizosaccharomyces osmophilus]WBW72606.1 microtubule-site clamp monopolin complex subunit Mde4 [Schizosaccharomyces osmophilus]